MNPKFHEDILGDILGHVVIFEHTVYETQQCGVVAYEELFVGSLVAPFLTAEIRELSLCCLPKVNFMKSCVFSLGLDTTRYSKIESFLVIEKYFRR